MFAVTLSTEMVPNGSAFVRSELFALGPQYSHQRLSKNGEHRQNLFRASLSAADRTETTIGGRIVKPIQQIDPSDLNRIAILDTTHADCLDSFVLRAAIPDEEAGTVPSTFGHDEPRLLDFFQGPTSGPTLDISELYRWII